MQNRTLWFFVLFCWPGLASSEPTYSIIRVPHSRSEPPAYVAQPANSPLTESISPETVVKAPTFPVSAHPIASPSTPANEDADTSDPSVTLLASNEDTALTTATEAVKEIEEEEQTEPFEEPTVTSVPDETAPPAEELTPEESSPPEVQPENKNTSEPPSIAPQPTIAPEPSAADEVQKPELATLESSNNIPEIQPLEAPLPHTNGGAVHPLTKVQKEPEPEINKFVANELPNEKPAVTSSGISRTLEEYLKMAYEANLDVAISNVGVVESQAEKAATYRDMLPTLSINTSRNQIVHSNSSSVGDSFSTAATVSQPIYRGGALEAGRNRSSLAERQAELNLKRTIQQLTYRVKAAWYEILAARTLRKEAEASLERLRQHESNAQAFYNEGTYWRNEVLQAKVRVAQGQQALAEAQNRETLAEASLNNILRQELDTPVLTGDTLGRVTMDWTLLGAYKYALKSRPDLQSAELAVERNEWQEESVASAMRPSVDLTANWNLAADDIDYKDRSDSQSVLLRASWDIFQWGRTEKRVEAAKARTKSSELEFESLKDSIHLEIKRTFLNVKEAEMTLDVLEKALAQAEDNFNVTQTRYREQLSTALDVLNAQDLLTQTRNSYTEALRNHLTSMAELELVIGKDALHLTDAG